MNVNNYEFQTLLDLKENLDLSYIQPSKTLIQIFSGLIEESELKELVKIIKDKNSEAIFIGTTTAGEIYNGNIYQNSIVVSVIEFSNVEVSAGYFSDANEFSLGEKIASTLFKDDTKVMFIFIDGLYSNGCNVISGINSVNKSIPISGGMAGDNGYFKNTFVFDSSGVYNKGAVAASLHGKELYVHTDYQLNWQPIGKIMTVTKVDDNHLYEVDNIPIVDIYRKYLGKRIADGLPHSAIEFPLIKITKDGMEICRSFINKFEDGSLQTIGNLFKGDKVQLAFGNVSLILSNTQNSIEKLYKYYPDAIFIYSCAARITFMQSEIVKELEPLNQFAPTSGFFTYGEIFHKNDKNHLLNNSMTILLLSEEHHQQNNNHFNNSQNELKHLNFFEGKHFLVLEALTNLTQEVISELETSKKEIEELHHQMQQSIDFASMIQQSLLPEHNLTQNYFKDSFIIWEPRDVVGGDIYIFEQLRHKDEALLMVIDCTGHGVPGAFVTMIVKTIERNIVSEIMKSDKEVHPAEILSRFNREIKTLLKQDHDDSLSNAGLDAGILYIDKSKKLIRFAGAEIPLFYIDTKGFNVIKGDRHSVGYRTSNADYVFKEHEITVEGTMSFYLSTDGYTDQNGGEKGFPLGKKRFEKIIKEYQHKSFIEQRRDFLYELQKYQGDENRNDDITVVGFCVY